MKILDVCCGSRMFWYDKQESHTTYMDIRRSLYTTFDRGNVREIEINPDIQADWKHIPFEDETFDLIVFDPPHLIRAGKTSWLAKKYGTLDLMTWPSELYKAFQEIMRVLKPTGTMLFKWNEDQIPVKEVFKAFGQLRSLNLNHILRQRCFCKLRRMTNAHLRSNAKQGTSF